MAFSRSCSGQNWARILVTHQLLGNSKNFAIRKTFRENKKSNPPVMQTYDPRSPPPIPQRLNQIDTQVQ